jgi:hypothetical protein
MLHLDYLRLRLFIRKPEIPFAMLNNVNILDCLYTNSVIYGNPFHGA